MKRLCCVVLVLVVLALAGAACRDKGFEKTRVVFTHQVQGNFYFQPEDSIGYYKLQVDSSGKCVYELDLKQPAYYRYVDAKMRYYSVFLTPGDQLEIIDTADSVAFKGDGVAENQFMNRHVLLGNSAEGVEMYSEAWLQAFETELSHKLGELQNPGLSPEFVRHHTLYYRFAYYRQLLGVAMMQMFSGVVPDMPERFYGFLKEIRLDDPLILHVPKWFSTMNDAFERMEKEGMIEISPENYMKIYASRIENDQLRSAFLVNLLELTLEKGYSDDIPAYVESVRALITDRAAISDLSAFEARYQEVREANKSIMRGMEAPAFQAADKNGKMYSSADFKGKIVVLDFWFTGCVPCRAEMPYMDRIAEEMEGQPICFISISLDFGDELMTLWKKMVQDHKGPVISLNAEGGFKSDLAKAYKISGVPRIVIIDKEGRIIDACAKRPSDPKLKMQLEELVKR